MVEDPAVRQRYVFRPAPDGQALEVELWVDPGGRVPPHLHPSQRERFEVVSGRLTFRRGRAKVAAGPGDVVEVEPGVRHSFNNTGSETAHMKVEVRPCLELQQFLEDLAALGRAGRYTRFGLPKSPSGMIQLALVARHYRETTVVLFPPPILQPLLLGPLARLAEARGYRPGRLAERN